MTGDAKPELAAYVKQATAAVALKLGFTEGRFDISSEPGSNCHGLVGEIHQATLTEGDRKEVLFCKIPPQDPVRREQFESMQLFEREVLMYTTLLPALFDFQRQRGIAEEDGFFSVPRCHYAHFDAAKDESLILMENLLCRDLRMLNKLEPVDYDHARLLMIQLGRLHGLSFAVRDQQPELYERLKVGDVMFPSVKASEALLGMFDAALDGAISLLGPEEDTTRSKMCALKKDFVKTMDFCLDGSNAEPYAVLNHGDCWVNNFMYGYKDKSPTELVLLDWQLARYVSPTLDLLYFLFCCTDEAFRAKHFHEMLQIYHSSLTSLLDRLGSDAGKLFPFEVLQEQLKQFGKFALILGSFDIPILCTDPAEMPDLDGGLEEAFATSPEAQARYASRMGGVIRDAIRFGIL